MITKNIKIAAIGTVFVGLASVLSACQSTSADQRNDTHKMHHKGDQRDGRSHDKQDKKYPMQQMQNVCQNQSVGAQVEMQMGKRTQAGTCQVMFMPNRDDMKSMMEMWKKDETSRSDKKSNMQQIRQSIQNACQGQKTGSNIQVKINGQTIDGKCEIVFQPNKMQ